MATIKGFIHYCQIRNPGLKWESTDKHWSVQVEVTEKTMKAFKKQCPASKDAIKEYTTAEFKKQFKCDPQAAPADSDEHYVIRIKQDCTINGKPFENAPKVVMKNDKGKLEDITKKTDVGNGSEGVVQFNIYESKKWKTKSAKLANVRVDNLIPYEGGGSDLSELGEMDEESFEDLEEDEDDAPFEPDEEDGEDPEEY
jgi:hypothetical protein